jgi:hypothetical protein
MSFKLQWLRCLQEKAAPHFRQLFTFVCVCYFQNLLDSREQEKEGVEELKSNVHCVKDSSMFLEMSTLNVVELCMPVMIQIQYLAKC